MLTLAIGADNLIRWDEMDLASNGVTVNDAVTSFVLKDAANAPVPGGSASMPYVPASAGRYDGILLYSVALTDQATYFLELTGISGAARGFRRIECVAAYQDED